MNTLQRVEYVTLRLVRRFVFTENMANRFSRWLPYYAPSLNEARPQRIVQDYLNQLQAAGTALVDARAAEIGAGRTNVVGYYLAGAGAKSVVAIEPYVRFDAQLDSQLRAAMPDLAAIAAGKVRRVHGFTDIPDASVDILLSNSVLEHVRDLATFFGECARVLAPGGVMMHRVDYRDHFFKYPYGFLTFSEKTWNRWLDPGDLPRWRLGDHLNALADAGFTSEVHDKQTLPEAFENERSRLRGRFADPHPDVAVTGAMLIARKPS